ncbi:phosphoribosylformylglycinamidine synthase subunit PurQ [Nitrospirillum viridazoti]|uniref:Phosphoribosylformylglycinamidine synthase subunit PurQ n=1 Tax=Nitrospirillum viridazoti CBAmc TaxID=1441467 RepID=A0A248JP90_9PROT|nr:phosphoribosylformylglycinamidine synthase subunit PurQ [Nitrospirillum amazonense]ASG20515.1 phosphoribosylformylglycinamidine synthase I [Nitrospirillum amazonense CBAmc]TWB34114.1 phosphoribosylformylglycinamidine synthase [Nitrospirillum amazonense]
MKSAVIVFPGSNCERDIAVALEQVSGHKTFHAWHRDTDLPEVDVIAVPGGFSYGDYLRCGAMAANSPVMRVVKERAAQGVKVIGVCNGFQILTEAGLLPGALIRNQSLKYICKTVDLKVENTDSAFTRHYTPGQHIGIPVGHGEGNYVADEETLKRLEGEGRVAFRYTDAAGVVNAAGNPNGATNNIAGIFNETRTVLGMMPHPERAFDPQHGNTDGRALFTSLLESLS